ncbi:MAG: type II toxin-antitoxin system death-on-curing family toxin [bacterium]
MKLACFLSVDEVVRIHDSMIDKFGGASGIREQGLLESAIFQAQVAFGGDFVCQDVYEMAAAYLYHIVKNHPFIDGNKRTGIVVATSFLDCQGYEIDLSQDEFYKLALDVANSKKDKPAIARLLKKKIIEN